jgi:hypothetical protein
MNYVFSKEKSGENSTDADPNLAPPFVRRLFPAGDLLGEVGGDHGAPRSVRLTPLPSTHKEEGITTTDPIKLSGSVDHP